LKIETNSITWRDIMGADAYWYYVPYEEDINNALQKLKKREFEAGRYRPVMYTGDLAFPMDDISKAPAPGKEHETIEEAIEDAMEDGTGSILDLEKISEDEYYSVAYILKKEELTKYFNTEKPTREIINENIDKFWDDVSDLMGVRGVGVCTIVYKNKTPSELFFMGYSWD